jgi:mRNA interferase RelE/StbE
MNIIATKTFVKQYAKTPAYLKKKVADLYLKIEATEKWSDIPGIKEMKSQENTYRIRVGDYRIGVQIIDKTLKLVVIMHRKEIYRFFP